VGGPDSGTLPLQLWPSPPPRCAFQTGFQTYAPLPLQDIGWFDRDENSSGRLATLLSTDAAYIRGAVGDVFGAPRRELDPCLGHLALPPCGRRALSAC
jgi:hypothetical protein